MSKKVLTCNGDRIIFHTDDVRVPEGHVKVKRERLESSYPPELREEVSLRVLKAKELTNVLKSNLHLKRDLYLAELRLFTFQAEKFWDVLEKVQRVEERLAVA